MINRHISTTITISGDTIREHMRIDQALTDRMASLSPRHRAKAWARIQGHRWYLYLDGEITQLVNDIRRLTS